MKLIRIQYLEASALVKLLVPENGSEELERYKKRMLGCVFCTTSLCFAETLGALKAKHIHGLISEEEYLTACDILLGWGSHEAVLELEDVEIKDRLVFMDVEKLVKKYQIDVSDAFQIVSIKRNPLGRSGNDMMLITGDKGLRDAARGEGVQVWYCVDEPEPRDTPEI